MDGKPPREAKHTLRKQDLKAAAYFSLSEFGRKNRYNHKNSTACPNVPPQRS